MTKHQKPAKAAHVAPTEIPELTVDAEASETPAQAETTETPAADRPSRRDRRKGSGDNAFAQKGVKMKGSGIPHSPRQYAARRRG